MEECAVLLLTRKADQTICIGSDIRITVLRITRRSVAIGIEAPHNVRILRGELLIRSGTRQTAKVANAGCNALGTASTTVLAPHPPHCAK